jgi:hypothetical protein
MDAGDRDDLDVVFVAFGIDLLLLIEKLPPAIGIPVVITTGILPDLLSCDCEIRRNRTGR